MGGVHEPIEIGDRLELFVDGYIVESLEDTRYRLHEPRPAPALLPLENSLRYATIIRDEDLFRFYTRDGSYLGAEGVRGEITLYLEGQDGIHWTKPALGVIERNGTSANNLVLWESPFSHNFSPMLDTRPGVAKDERFKALAGLHRTGLVAFASGDGVRWRKIREEAVIPSEAPWETPKLFDSQNVSFWSESEGCYVCYYRTEVEELRRIARMTSADYRTWGDARLLDANLPGEHLYMSQTHPYFRAPHIYLSFPTRYFPDRGNSTDILFMAARGAGDFVRLFPEALIRPGLDPKQWENRANQAALNVIPTGPEEMSMYIAPAERYVWRTDGIVSVNAGYRTGRVVTRPLVVRGQELIINYSTSAGGRLAVEIQHIDGTAVPGYAIGDCRQLVGNRVEQTVCWAQGARISGVDGKPVRLVFEMQEADLYSFRFRG